MIADIPYVVLITCATLVGLHIANICYDYKVPHYISRKIGHFAGGAGYLFCVLLFQSPVWPIILSLTFTILLGISRGVGGPYIFRGVARTVTLAEIWFPLSSTMVLIVGWGILNEPLVSVACILMMAWGDMVTGLVRHQVYKKPVKGLWGSLAMFIVCLILSWCFIKPLYLGVIVALVATVTEYLCGDVSRVKFLRLIDDNLAIPIVAMLVAFGGLYFIGG